MSGVYFLLAKPLLVQHEHLIQVKINNDGMGLYNRLE